MAQDNDRKVTVEISGSYTERIGSGSVVRVVARSLVNEDADMQPLIDWLKANGYVETNGEGLIG